MRRGRGARRGQTGPEAPRRPTLLIIDDILDNREMYAEYFRACGWNVHEAADGAAGLDIARAELPDAIVLDLSMPRLDGWLATRKLREDVATQAIAIIVLSGFAMTESRRSALDAGADLFVAKPCLPEELKRHVEQVVANRRRQPPAAL